MSRDGETYSPLFDVFVLGRAVGSLLEAALAGGPLTPAEYARYSVVFEEEAVSPSAMARRLSMPLTTVIDDLAVMERRGHVRRVRNPRDGRSFQVVLTAEGLAAHRDTAVRFEAAHGRFLAELPVPAAEAQRLLRELTAAAERATAQVPREPQVSGR